MKRALLVAVVLSCLVAFLTAGCRVLSHQSKPVQFVDVTEKVGIHFLHNNGNCGRSCGHKPLKYMPETTGSGCAFIDYNNDGYQDIFLVNSRDWNKEEFLGYSHPDIKKTELVAMWTKHQPKESRCALYRNNKGESFTDVTEEAGLGFLRNVYGMGVCVGDYDNDGDEDIYMTCLGPNFLLRNEGDGTFKDVTKEAGVAGIAIEPGGIKWKWGASCAWFDYDKDGDLDLFVENYVKWTPKTDVWCGHNKIKGYCPPQSYEPTPNILYRNEGNGRFTDVSGETGISKHHGKAWGVAICDFDGDGWEDIAVANDTWRNFLFKNIDGKRFEEIGIEAGIAFSDMGQARAGMGIDVSDFENKGRFGILIGNFSHEGLALWRNEGELNFTEITHEAGMGDVSLPFLTFGLFWFDYDLDGWKDAFVSTGHIDDIVNTYDSKITYAQRQCLYHNKGDGTFEEVGLKSGEPFKQKLVVRGAAWGDYDNDGDPDILIMGNNITPRCQLWKNEGGSQNHWIKFKVVGTKSNRSGIGTKIKVTAGDITQTDFVRSGCSYLSQSDLRPTFGLGRHKRADLVEITFPSGTKKILRGLEADKIHIIQE